MYPEIRSDTLISQRSRFGLIQRRDGVFKAVHKTDTVNELMEYCSVLRKAVTSTENM